MENKPRQFEGLDVSSLSGARTTRGRTATVCIALTAALLLTVVLCAMFGSQKLPVWGTVCELFSAGTGNCGLSADQTAILFDIRLSRIILAATVGASLSAAGAAYQALLRNPLAEPYLLGVSNGAAVGTMVALLFFASFAWTRPLFAFCGAGLSTLVVYRLAKSKVGATPERLILAGVIVTTFLSSAIVFMTSLMDATRIRSFTFWLLGDLSESAGSFLWIAIPVVLIGTLILILFSRPLNLMMIGERDAFDLGVEVGRVRLCVFIAAGMLVGTSVASSGSVGYVGLVVPHLVRLSFGSDNRLTIPAAAIGGAIFVVATDTIARTIISPRELPVGAITALIGGPLFVFLLRRR